MIVEDEGITALRVKASLEEMGYAVSCICESGEEAVKKAGEERPDLVIMDITLSGEMDGIEASRRIRSCSKIPVVYLTAHSDDTVFQRAKITEPFGYIVKPFDDRELNIAVEIALYKYKMEAALRESRKKYQTLFKNANDAIYLIDAVTLRIVDCNPEAEKISGYKTRQLKAMTAPELHPEEEQNVVISIFRKINKMRTLSGISGLNQMTQDGRLVPVEINASKIRMGGKNYFMVVFRDITIRKITEESVKNERNKLIGILEAMDDGVYIVSRDYIIEYMNPSFKKEFRTMKGHKCYEYFHGRKKACPVCKHKEVFAGETVHWEWTSSKKGKSFDIIDTPLKNPDGSMSKLAILRDITERKQMEARIKAASVTDELTGLLNRRGFFALAEHHIKFALRSGKEAALIYLDLDNFKSINDRLGHKAGDEALTDMADLLRNTFRESDITARIGGDEFAVLLADDLKSGFEETVTRHLEDNLRLYNEREGRPYYLSFSMGMSVYNPMSPCSLDDLLNRADALMYDNKKEHRAGRRSIQTVRERREHKRVKTGDEITAEINNSFSAVIRDLSTGGIRLEAPEQLEASAGPLIRILLDGKEVMESAGRLVWQFSSAARTGKYEAGLKFINPGDKVKRSLEQLIRDLEG